MQSNERASKKMIEETQRLYAALIPSRLQLDERSLMRPSFGFIHELIRSVSHSDAIEFSLALTILPLTPKTHTNLFSWLQRRVFFETSSSRLIYSQYRRLPQQQVELNVSRVGTEEPRRNFAKNSSTLLQTTSSLFYHVRPPKLLPD